MIKITTKWELHGEESVKARLRAIKRRSNNFIPVWERIATDTARLNQMNFASGGGLSGGWAPLDPEYAAVKVGAMMVVTGRLMGSVANRPFGIESLTPKQMEIGTNVPYAKYHQYGTSKMPQRTIWIFRRETVSAWMAFAGNYIMNGPG